MSETHLNDLSKVYLDQIATNRKAEQEADVKRWEEIGGPTPTNYKPTGNSAKIRIESRLDKNPPPQFEKGDDDRGNPDYMKSVSYADEKKWERLQRMRRASNKDSVRSKATEGFSNWREEYIAEYGDPSAVGGPAFKTEKDAEKKVKEVKGINNKIVINPKLAEVVQQMGGELIEAKEVDCECDDCGQDPCIECGESHHTVSEDANIEGAVEYFYEEGINEDGIDLLIEEIGLEEFVDFIEGGAVYLNEERAARRASVRAKSFEKVKAAVDKADAAKKAAKKGEYAPSYAKKETDVTVYDDDKPAAKKPAAPKKVAAPKKPVAPKKPAAPAKPAAPKKPVAKKVVKAVAKVKPAQPKKEVSKSTLRDKIKSAYQAGVKRHRKATQPVRVFHKGMKAGAKKTVKFAKDVKKAVVGESAKSPSAQERAAIRKRKTLEKLKDKKQQAAARALAKTTHRATGKFKKYDSDGDGRIKVIDAGYNPEGEIIEEDNLAGREQMIQRKQLVLDRQKLKLRMRAQAAAKKDKKASDSNADAQANVITTEAKVDTGSAEEKASARNLRNTPPGGNRKFDTSVFITRKPGESLDSARTRKRREAHAAKRGMKEDRAFDNVVAALRKKYGESGVLTKDSPKPKAQPQPKAKPQKPLTDKEKAHREVIARYGGEANYKAGRGLGT